MKLLKSFIITLLSLTSGCTAIGLVPPLPGPMMIPSSAGSAYTAYAVSTDERGVSAILDDEALELSIHQALIKNKDLDSSDFYIYSYNSNLYILGKYAEKSEIATLKKIVRKNGKANSLTTYLFDKKDINPNYIDDKMLELKIKQALLDDEKIYGTNFQVKSIEGNVILLGRVANINEANHAKAITYKVSGVRTVKSFVRATRQQRFKNTAK